MCKVWTAPEIPVEEVKYASSFFSYFLESLFVKSQDVSRDYCGGRKISFFTVTFWKIYNNLFAVVLPALFDTFFTTTS